MFRTDRQNYFLSVLYTVISDACWLPIQTIVCDAIVNIKYIVRMQLKNMISSPAQLNHCGPAAFQRTLISIGLPIVQCVCNAEK